MLTGKKSQGEFRRVWCGHFNDEPMVDQPRGSDRQQRLFARAKPAVDRFAEQALDGGRGQAFDDTLVAALAALQQWSGDVIAICTAGLSTGIGWAHWRPGRIKQLSGEWCPGDPAVGRG